MIKYYRSYYTFLRSTFSTETMDHTVDEILQKLNLTQLKSLIALYGLEKPHSKSTKNDYILYIQNSNISLDSRMLVNYFNLTLKQKKITKPDPEISNEEVVKELSNITPKKISRSRSRSIKHLINKN